MDTLMLVIAIFGTFSILLLVVLFGVINRLSEVNKQLLIVVAGQNQKPEALRALVASAKPPQGKLKGITDGKKKKDDKLKNTNYTMSIGI